MQTPISQMRPGGRSCSISLKHSPYDIAMTKTLAATGYPVKHQVALARRHASVYRVRMTNREASRMVRKWRKASGLTQKQAARKMRTHQSRVSEIENEGAYLSESLQAKIARVCA